jgi:hypothetical protein
MAKDLLFSPDMGRPAKWSRRGKGLQEQARICREGDREPSEAWPTHQEVSKLAFRPDIKQKI